MLATLQQPVASLRGRNGEIVFYPVRDRQFIRTFVQPNNPDSEAQAAIRAYTTAASQAYNLLDETEILAWELFAANFVQNDRNGNSYTLNGKSAYVKVNVWRQMAGQAITDVAPTYGTGAALTSIVDIGISGTDLEIQWTGTPVAAGQFLRLELTANLGSFARKPRPNDYRIAVFPFSGAFAARGAAGSGTITIATASLRLPIAVGNIVGVRVTPFNASYLAGNSLSSQLEVLAV